MMSIWLKVMMVVLLANQGTLFGQYFVRQGSDISDFEKQVLNNRFPIIKKAIEIQMGQVIKDNYVPSIAAVMSGGGCRATIASLAFIDALNQLGFLDTCSYLSTLSGSTWMLGSLLAHQCSPEELKNYLQATLAAEKTWDVAAIFSYLKEKSSIYNQSITLTDIFGCFLSYIFLKKLPHSPLKVHLSNAYQLISSGDYPFPLFNAVLTNVAPYEFIEFSPCEVGSADFLATWVKTEAFGKEFDNGESFDQAPEQSLGFLLGVFGSAYAAGAYDAIRYLVKNLKNHWNNLSAPNDLEQYCKHTKLSEDLNDIERQLNNDIQTSNLFQTAARVHNFTKGLDSSPIKNDNELVPVDAGLRCNLPFAPLFIPARKIEFYIVCDVSSGAKSDVIEDLEDYAKHKGYRLPRFDYKKIDNNEVCCFYDDTDPSVPVIVYIPHVADVATLKFSYTEQEFNDLYDSMVRRVKDAKYVIQEGIRIAVCNTIKRVEDSSSAEMTDPTKNSSLYGCIIS